VIESVGVLHHLSDPASGLKVLTSLLQPDGLMLIGLYSAAARRQENAARAYLAEQGYQPTTDGIRAGRQDLIQRGNALRTADFFTISGCRDLMFNVMERQFTIPAIKTLLAVNGLKFIGFEVSPGVTEQFRQRFADPAAGSDLECWCEFEEKQPWTFAEMYVFWVELAPNVAAIV
jgi:SAM-dependent methyltransferase